MGGKNCKPVLSADEVKLRLTTEQIARNEKHWQLLARNDSKTARIPKDVFIRQYLKKILERRPLHSGFASKPVLERFFVVLDSNNSGAIEFDEFMSAKYIFEHILKFSVWDTHNIRLQKRDELREHRLHFVFNLYDIDFNGVVSQKELRKVLPVFLQGNANPSPEVKEFLNPLVLAASNFAMDFAKDRNGLTLKDFRRFAMCDDISQTILSVITPQDMSVITPQQLPLPS